MASFVVGFMTYLLRGNDQVLHPLLDPIVLLLFFLPKWVEIAACRPNMALEMESRN